MSKDPFKTRLEIAKKKVSKRDLEIKKDNHPIIFITGKDIVEILIKSGKNDENNLKNYLNELFEQ